MNSNLRALFILFCFGVIRSETDNKVNSTLSKSGVHSTKEVRLSKNESELHTSDKDQCTKKLRSKLEQKPCDSSKVLVDKLRCDLIHDITYDVCAGEHIPNLEPYFQPNSPDCQENYVWRNTSGSTIFLFLTDWNSVCKKMCNNEQIKRICEFIINYYVSQKVSNEAQLLSNNEESGVKPVGVNGAGDRESQDTDNVPEDGDNIPPENEQKTGKEEDQKQGNARKRVLDSSSIKNADDPKKSDSFKDEQASNSVKNVDIEKYPGEASQATPEKMFHSANIDNEGDSHVLFYFLLVSGMCIAFYFMMYKKKILALVIEGRRRNVKRRPNSAAYSKLDCNLEEAMSSGPSTSTSNTLMY